MKNNAAHHYNKGVLTEGPISRHLMRLTIPMTWGIFAVISFQLADLFFISYLGTEALAALSFTIPVTYGIFSLFIGFQIAMASLASRLIGEKKIDQMRQSVMHGLILVGGAGFLFAAMGLYFHDGIFKSMGADETTMPLIRDYMLVWFGGIIFVAMPMIGNAAMRAGGDSMTPAIIMSVAAIINIILDPIFIFGLFGFPRLEIQGAALTTVFANAGALAASLYIMKYRKKMLLPFREIDWGDFKNSAKKLLSIALPAGLTNAIQPAVNAFILSLLTGYGTAAVAAFGIVTRIEAFAFIVLMALATGMAPVIGQNWGARDMGRVRETLKLGIGFNVIWSLAMAIILIIGGEAIAAAFSSDPAIIHIMMLYFWIVPLSYALGNLVMGWASAFNAIGRPERAFVMIVLKMIVILIPAALIGEHLWGVGGIFAGIALANILAGGAFHILNRAIFNKLEPAGAA